MTEERDENRESPPTSYFKEHPQQSVEALESADALESAESLRSASLKAPEPDQEFLTGYMGKLAKEQQIIKAKNKGIIYLPVGTMKFTLLCMCMPFHAYEIWWLYKNFVCQKERDGKLLSPLWRVNMALLYLRKLLEAMRDEGKLYGLADQLPIEKIVLYWCLLFCCSFFPAPWGLLGTFSFAPFIFVNEYLLKLNKVANPDLKLDTSYSVGDFAVIIFGGAFFALNLYMAMIGH